MNYKNIFENLKTVRDFKKTKIDAKVLREIKLYAKSLDLPLNSNFEVIGIDGKEGYTNLNGKIGYFGKLIEAPLYLAIVGCENTSLTDAGYFTEALRFKIQELGLGSCWISVEDSSAVDELLSVKKTITMLAVGEIYNGIFKKDIQKKAERNAVSDMVFDKKWGSEITWEALNAKGLDEVFYFARFAPSWGNVQPWKFVLDETKIYLLIETQEEKSFDLESGIVTFFLEKACIAAGVRVETSCKQVELDLGQPQNYKIRGVFSL